MARDNDTDGFLGITYIPHGNDHAVAVSDSAAQEKSSDKPKKSVKRSDTTSAEVQKMHEQLAALEKELQEYELETEERLKHLERMAGHPITAEEKVFRIQEDS